MNSIGNIKLKAIVNLNRNVNATQNICDSISLFRCSVGRSQHLDAKLYVPTEEMAVSSPSFPSMYLHLVFCDVFFHPYLKFNRSIGIYVSQLSILKFESYSDVLWCTDGTLPAPLAGIDGTMARQMVQSCHQHASTEIRWNKNVIIEWNHERKVNIENVTSTITTAFENVCIFFFTIIIIIFMIIISIYLPSEPIKWAHA